MGNCSRANASAYDTEFAKAKSAVVNYVKRSLNVSLRVRTITPSDLSREASLGLQADAAAYYDVAHSLIVLDPGRIYAFYGAAAHSPKELDQCIYVLCVSVKLLPHFPSFNNLF
jgi:hypothetical protein